MFDFKVDREAESLLINGYALKLVPQRVRNLSLFAAVLPPNHPALSAGDTGSAQVKSPDVVEALAKLDRNGLITADVDLFVTYNGDTRVLGLRVQVVQVEGKQVVHKDLLTALIATPRPPSLAHGHGHSHPAGPNDAHPSASCPSSDWKCRVSNWVKSLMGHKPCAGGRYHGMRPRPGTGVHGEQRRPDESFRGHGGNGDYHRHRFHRPRRGFMRFVIHVVVPVLIGAAAGIAIGILSVFLVEIVGGIVMRIRGRARDGMEYHEITDAKEYVAGEEEEELPVYEETERVPEYTDTDEKRQQQ